MKIPQSVVTAATILWVWGFFRLTSPPILAASFTYDTLDRLKSASYDNGLIITYTYDAEGNRLSRAITAPSAPPTIVTAPSPQIAIVGQPVTFTVVSAGNPTPTYQWRKGSTTIPGATSATYTITSVGAADAGSFDVVITNSRGSVTTTAVSLTVTAPAATFSITPSTNGNGTITPASVQQVKNGESVTFSSSPSAGYTVGQWFVNGISTQTGGSTLTVQNVSATTSVQVSFVSNPSGFVLQPGPSDANDIWTTSVYSYAPGGATPGGGSNEDTLRIGGWGDTYVALISFKLDSMPTVAQSAKLYLYCYSNNSGSPTGVYVDRVISAWNWQTSGTGRDRLRLWWADKPLTAPLITSVLPAPSLRGWYELDVTGIYNDWQGGAVPNYGIELRPAATNNNFDFFYSGDYVADPSLRPKLVVIPKTPDIYFALQPTSLTITEGASASFSALASGSSTPTYQWYLNDVAVLGATNATYSISSVSAAKAGNYSVVATNAQGSVTSSVATLAVNTVPVIIAQPTSSQVASGAQVTFSVTTTGSPQPTYQWSFNGAPIPGATGSSYVLPSVSASDAGDYVVAVSNVAGSLQSNAAKLTVTQPAPPPPTASNPPPATVPPPPTTPTPSVPVSPPPVVVAPPTPTVPAPTITQQPISRTVTVGTSMILQVFAADALTYQWAFNGVPIVGATASSYSVPSISPANDGSYVVTVSSSGGIVTSAPAIVTVIAPPVFTQQPSSQQIRVGSAVTFSSTATGRPAPSYQWLHDGNIIPGATNASYRITTALSSDSGSYSVIASNSVGESRSQGAMLSVTSPQSPVIASEPQSHNIASGGTVVLSVALSGQVSVSSLQALALSIGPTFQWYLNGALLSGETNQRLVLRNVSAASAGNYNCLISNEAGSSLSRTAAISVSPPTASSRLVNISTRAIAQSGDATLIAGFAVQGTGNGDTIPILVRANGPVLRQFGVDGSLPDPALTLQRGSSVLASTKNWTGDQQIASIAASVSAFPWSISFTQDAALYMPQLGAGAYTAKIDSPSGATGVALIEIYEGTPQSAASGTARLVNISSRTYVGKDQNILIAGFVIAGATSKTVLIRGAGPALRNFAVTGTLTRPRLQLFSSDKALIIENLGWGGDRQIVTIAATTGAFSFGDQATNDCAILITLAPGGYTAQLSGMNGETGVGMVEIYDVP